MADAEQATETFQRWRRGEPGALEALTPLLYDELRRLAASYMRRERADHTLQPTALAHEAFLRLIEQRNVSWQNRAHFFGIAAQLMRRILADHARRHNAARRGGGAARVPLEALEFTNAPADVAADEIDVALEDLARLDPRQARIVELRFFGGLTIEETAEVVGVSPATVKRDWLLARAWLFRELGGAA